MKFLTIPFCFFTCVYDNSTVDIIPKLKKNILNFGYGVYFKYKGMLAHSFDRFYVVTKFKIPKLEDLKLMTVTFASQCSYANETNIYVNRLLRFCKRIAPYVKFCQNQITYYNKTAYDILENEISLILPNFAADKRPKRGVILASVLGGITSSIIGLAYEGISSFLHHRRHQALHKAVKVMEKKSDSQKDQIHHLEDTMIMYGAYNSDNLKDLIDTLYRMQNISGWREKMFTGHCKHLIGIYTQQYGMHNYAMNSIIFLTTVREKYVRMYERFIEELKSYSKVIRVISK